MDDEFDISAGLRKEIRDLSRRERLEVPEAVDARIRAAARRPGGRLIRIRRAVVAAAAVLLLALGLWGHGERSDDAFAGVGDLDADGSVDIVDAYLLDRQLGSTPVRGDVDRDGRVDAADVRHLIEMVVSVGRRG